MNQFYFPKNIKTYQNDNKNTILSNETFLFHFIQVKKKVYTKGVLTKNKNKKTF